VHGGIYWSVSDFCLFLVWGVGGGTHTCQLKGGYDMAKYSWSYSNNGYGRGGGQQALLWDGGVLVFFFYFGLHTCVSHN